MFIEIDLENGKVTSDDLVSYDDTLLYWKGDAINPYEYGYEELSKDIRNESYLKKIKDYSSEFSLVIFEQSTKNLKVYTDLLGKNIIFYYLCDSSLYISDDFYEIANRVVVDEKVINLDYIKQITIHNISLNNETLVKNLNCIPASCCLSFSILENKLQVLKYNDFSFKKNDTLTLTQAADETYEIFNEFFSDLKRFKSDYSFGIGLSGGLDSRIIASLAIDHKLDLNTFCIGEKKSGFIKTNGFLLSEKIRQVLNIKKYKFIEYNKSNLKEKLANEILYYPYKSSNIQISNLSELPEFDYMLNGEHGGVFFGEFDYSEVCEYNIESIAQYLLSFLSFNNKKEMILGEEDISNYTKVVTEKVNGYNLNDRFDCFYKFFFEEYGSKSKFGFFESAYGKRPRYTPFLDRKFVEFFLTWPTYLRFDRLIQYELIKKHFPELSLIPDESSDAPIIYRKNGPKFWLIRFIFALKNKVFGPSLNQNKWITRDKKLFNVYLSIVNENTEFLNEYFPKLDVKVFYKENPRAAMNLMKCLLLKELIINTEKVDKATINSYFNKIELI